MEKIKTIFAFCICLGIITSCIIIIISRILRWLSPKESRNKRLDILSWIAFFVLTVFMLLYLKNNLNINANKNIIHFFRFSCSLISFFVICIIVALVMVLLMLIAFCIYYSLKVFISTKKRDKNLGEQSENFVEKINSPVVIFTIALSILALFIIIPFLIGDQKLSKPIDIWENGAYEINDFFSSKNNNENATWRREEAIQAANLNNGVSSEHNVDNEQSSNTLVTTYILIYIIVLGVTFTFFRILYSIIEHSFENKKKINLINEYSSSIAFLAVGVALLWTLRGGELQQKTPLESFAEILKSFVMVISIFAISILTLEIIRLLMDMRQKIIREEARLLFIALIGHCSVLLMDIVFFFFGTVHNAIGISKDFAQIGFVNKLRRKLAKTIKKNLDAEDSQTDRKNPERYFAVFDEQIIKK